METAKIRESLTEDERDRFKGYAAEIFFRMGTDIATSCGGDLRFPAPPSERPYVVASFVSMLDGVVSFSLPGEYGGASISGANPGDRFIMGLLRASADAVLVGSGTVATVSPTHLWVAECIYPPAADSYGQYRQPVLGKPENLASMSRRLPVSVVSTSTAIPAVWKTARLRSIRPAPL